MLVGHNSKVTLRELEPVVTQAEYYTGRSRHCDTMLLAGLPEEPNLGTPLSLNIMTLIMLLYSVLVGSQPMRYYRHGYQRYPKSKDFVKSRMKRIPDRSV